MDEKFYTSDGVVIKPGMKITNYNGAEDTVIRLLYVENESIRGIITGKRVAWWVTEKGTFDGSRMEAL